jgi:hypothetical protein
MDKSLSGSQKSTNNCNSDGASSPAGDDWKKNLKLPAKDGRQQTEVGVFLRRPENEML